MTTILRTVRSVAALAMILAFVLQETTSVLAGTTGSITGSVADANTGKPIAGARVTATSPSQSAAATTDAADGSRSCRSRPTRIRSPAARRHLRRRVGQRRDRAGGPDRQRQRQPAHQAQGDRLGHVARRVGAGEARHDRGRVLDQRRHAGQSVRAGRRRFAQQRVVRDLVGPRRVRRAQSDRLHRRGGDAQHPRRRLRPDRLRARRYPGQPCVRQLPVGLAVVAGPARAPGLHRRDARQRRSQRHLRLHQPGHPHRHRAGIALPRRRRSARRPSTTSSRSRRAARIRAARSRTTSARARTTRISATTTSSTARACSQLWGAPLAACNAAAVPRAVAPSCYGPQGADYTNGGAIAGVRARAVPVRRHGRPRVATATRSRTSTSASRARTATATTSSFCSTTTSSTTCSTTRPTTQGGAAFLDRHRRGRAVVRRRLPFHRRAAGHACFRSDTPAAASTPYLFPARRAGAPFGAPIAPDRRDAFTNNQAIVKLQYQRNFGTNAFLRVYGYTYYSDWLQNGPQSTSANYLGSLPSRLRARQPLARRQRDVLRPAQLAAPAVAARLVHDGVVAALQQLRASAQTGRVGYLVDATNPYAGTATTHRRPPARPGSQTSGTGVRAVDAFTLKPGVHATPSSRPSTFGDVAAAGRASTSLGSNGVGATYNTVVPKFYASSITRPVEADRPPERQPRPAAGPLRVRRLRHDQRRRGARALVQRVQPGAPHQRSSSNVPRTRSRRTTSWQPRVGLHLHARARPRCCAPATAATPRRPTPRSSSTTTCSRTTSARSRASARSACRPRRAIRCGRRVSNNYDFSVEHQFNRDTVAEAHAVLAQDAGSDPAVLPRPAAPSFISGLNVGRQTSEGLEFELDKGDFSRNGLAARLTFTYTNSYINYTKLGGGLSVVDGYNQAIAAYNAYTPCRRRRTVLYRRAHRRERQSRAGARRIRRARRGRSRTRTTTRRLKR